MRASGHGFTIVELLIAGALLGLLLSALGGIYVSTTRAYETNRQVTSSAERIRSAIETVQYDLGLAGYCGQTDSCGIGSTPLSLSIKTEEGSMVVESITSRYMETRFTESGPAVRQVSFEVEDQTLYRTEDGAKAAIASGIDRLVLVGYRRPDFISGAIITSAPSPNDIGALELRLEYEALAGSTHETFTVVMENLR